MSARIPWVFTDPKTAATYSWPINPKDHSPSEYAKTMTYSVTSAGNPIVYEGSDPVKTMSFSGTVLTEEQYDAMIEWFNKRYLLQVTDDLDRTFGIYITKFSPKRERGGVRYPWRHSYSCEALVVDW